MMKKENIVKFAFIRPFLMGLICNYLSFLEQRCFSIGMYRISILINITIRKNSSWNFQTY